MKEKITYRLALSDDADDLVQLGVQSYSQFAKILTPENWRKLEQSLRNKEALLDLIKRGWAFVAVDDPYIVGMIYLVPGGNPTDIYDSECCYIRKLGVNPAYKGLGIGRELVKLCIKQARENGEKIMVLHTSEIMNAARHIYESVGFKRLKEIDPMFGKRYWMYMLELK